MNLPPPLAALAQMLRRDVAEIREAIQEQGRPICDTTEAAQHKADSEKNTSSARPPDKNFIAEVRPNDPKGQSIQTSIKWATWLAAWSALAAVVAASIYAGIAYRTLTKITEQTGLLRTANEQAKTQWDAEHRPWVGGGDIGFTQPPTFFVYPGNPMQGTQINLAVVIPIKNFGISPAFHVEMELAGAMSKTIAAPPTLDSMMESACTWANRNSKDVGEVLFPNSPETRLERSESIGVPLIRVGEVQRVWVAICIAYSAMPSGEKLHHTKIWMASWPINGKPTEIGRNRLTIIYSLPITRWGLIKTEVE